VYSRGAEDILCKYSFQASFKPTESFHHVYVPYSFSTALHQNVEDNKLANQNKLFFSSWTSVKCDSSLKEVPLPAKRDNSF